MDELLQRFETLARARPAAPLVLAPGRSSSRGDLLGALEVRGPVLATALGAWRGSAGFLVALDVAPGPGLLVDFLACRALGACLLLLDHGLAPEEKRRVARQLGAACLLDSTPASLDEPDSSPRLEELGGAAHFPEAACLKLTSGSTGAPSGVLTPTASLLADGEGLIRSMEIREEDRIYAAVPMSHSYGLSILATPAWIQGTALVFPAEAEELAAVRACAATVYPSVPSWYDARVAGKEDSLPPSVRLWMSAGAPLRPATARAWRERFGQGVHAFYGSSECGGITFDRRGDAAERGSVGTPVEGVDVALEDGLVVVRSAAVTLGYHPPGEERDARIEPGVFRTEDLGRLEGGELWIEGRRSQWINVKGKKVNPREVEAVLLEHPAVRDVVVHGRPLPEERGELIRAVLVCEGELAFSEVLDWCRPRLAPHKFPRAVLCVAELPRTERGKLDRQALAALD